MILISESFESLNELGIEVRSSKGYIKLPALLKWMLTLLTVDDYDQM